MFVGVKYMDLPRFLRGLEVEEPNDADVSLIRERLDKLGSEDRIFVIISNNRRYHVVAAALQILENELDIFDSPFAQDDLVYPNTPVTKLEFAEIVAALCKRPAAYTLQGTLPEVRGLRLKVDECNRTALLPRDAKQRDVVTDFEFNRENGAKDLRTLDSLILIPPKKRLIR